MKRITALILSVFILSAVCMPLTAFADNKPQDTDITIFIDDKPVIDLDENGNLRVDEEGKEVPAKVKQIEVGGYAKTFVPLRAVFEALGCTVGYKETEQGGYVTIQKGITAVSLQEYNPYVSINDLAEGPASTAIDEAKDANGNYVVVPQNIDDRLYIPLRKVAEALYCNVIYDGVARKITIHPDYSVKRSNSSRFAIVDRTKYENEEPKPKECFVYDISKNEKLNFSGNATNQTVNKIETIFDPVENSETGNYIAFKVVIQDNNTHFFVRNVDHDTSHEFDDIIVSDNNIIWAYKDAYKSWFMINNDEYISGLKEKIKEYHNNVNDKNEIVKYFLLSDDVRVEFNEVNEEEVDGVKYISITSEKGTEYSFKCTAVEDNSESANEDTSTLKIWKIEKEEDKFLIGEQ